MLKIKDMNLNNVIRQGDSQPREYQLDTGNLNLNLTNKSATIRLMTADFQGIGYETTATVSSENKISFSIDDVIPARQYRLEVTVDDYVFPSRATDGQFNIDPSSHGQEANIIQVIGKDEIVREVKEQIEPFLGEIEQAEREREETYEKVKDLPEAFQNVIDETTGKDVISAPEIIAARRGKASLGAKIDEVDRQLAQTERVKIGGGVKGSLSDFDEETLNFIHDGTGGPIEIGSRPEDYSVGPKQTTFIKVSSNLLNTNEREDGKRTNVTDGSLESHNQFAVSDFIPVKKGTQYTMYGIERYSLYDSGKNHISSRTWAYGSTITTVTTTENTHFIRVSFRQEIYNALYAEVRLNEGGELLPYEPVYKPILDRDKVEIVIDEIAIDDIVIDDISAEQTNFISIIGNLYKGDFTEGVGLSAIQTVDRIWSETSYDEKTPLAYMEIEDGETYTIQGKGLFNRFIVAFSNELERNSPIERLITKNTSGMSLETTTVTNTDNHKYLLLNIGEWDNTNKILSLANIDVVKGQAIPDNYPQIFIGGVEVSHKHNSAGDNINNTLRYSDYYTADNLSPDQYETYDEVYDVYDSFVDNSNGYVTRSLLGHDGQNNPIYAYRFGREEVLNDFGMELGRLGIMSGLHGNEKGPVMSLMNFMKDLVYNPHSIEKIDRIKSLINFYVIPVGNPSGFNAYTRNNWNDVNINRNFDSGHWENIGDEDKGPSPASELETQLIQNWMLDNELDEFIDFHRADMTNTTDIATWYAGTSDMEWEMVTKKEYFNVLTYLSGRYSSRFEELPNNINFGRITEYYDRPQSQTYANSQGILGHLLETTERWRYFPDGERQKLRTTWGTDLIGNFIYEISKRY